MSENTLIEKIKQDKAAAVAEVKEKGATEVESIQRETEAAVKKMIESHSLSLKKKQEQMELVAVSRAKQEGKIAVQQAKRNQIDALFTEVTEELIGQPATEYTAFFTQFATEIIPESAEIVSVKAPDSRQAETKEILEKTGLSGEVETDSSIKAGFIAYTNDGVYDVTLERLMNEKRAELEMIIVKKVAV